MALLPLITPDLTPLSQSSQRKINLFVSCFISLQKNSETHREFHSKCNNFRNRCYRVPFGPVQRKGKKKEQRIHRRMSNRFPIPSIRHTRNVEYTVDCHSRVIDGFWRRPISAREEEISPYLFFARSIYTVQPCERDIRDSLVAHDTRRIVHRCTAT